MTEQLSLFNPIDNTPYVPVMEPVAAAKNAIAPPAPPAPPATSTTVETPTFEPGQRVKVAADALLFPGKVGQVAEVGGLGVAVEIDGMQGPPYPKFAPEQLEPAPSGAVQEWRWWPEQQRWHYTGHIGLAEATACIYPNSRLFPASVDPNKLGVPCPS